MYFGDSTYILVIIGMLLVMWAQSRVTRTFDKFNEVPTAHRIRGREAAQAILDAKGLTDVAIEPVSGNLTDHYDPVKKVLRLSEATYDSMSIAAVAVAAHECGHAVQDGENYQPLRFRSALVPLTNIGSTISIPLILMGILLGMAKLTLVGIVAFSLVLIFQLVTLPVEFDASRRAMTILESHGLLASQEIGPARSVLNAAAWTYVMSAFSTALQLLRFIILMGRQRND